jgi:hypothetical protein
MSDFEITIPGGPMVCGYCGQEEHWEKFPPVPAHLALGYLQLTGFRLLGVGPEGELVVLAEATNLSGDIIHLPHLCDKIPDSVRDEYADDIRALIANRSTP